MDVNDVLRRGRVSDRSAENRRPGTGTLKGGDCLCHLEWQYTERFRPQGYSDRDLVSPSNNQTVAGFPGVERGGSETTVEREWKGRKKGRRSTRLGANTYVQDCR